MPHADKKIAFVFHPRVQDSTTLRSGTTLSNFDDVMFRTVYEGSKHIVTGKSGVKGQQKPDQYRFDSSIRTTTFGEDKNWSIKNKTDPVRYDLARQISRRINTFFGAYIPPHMAEGGGFRTERIQIEAYLELMGRMNDADCEKSIFDQAIEIAQYATDDPK